MAHSVARLTVAWCTLFVVGTDLFVVSPLLPQIAAQYDLPPAPVGLSVTAFSVTYMICAPLLGHIADRLGRRLMLSCCLGGFAVANLLTAASPNLGWLLAARIVAGAMTAGVSPSIYALVGESAPAARRASWMAMAVSGLLCSLSFGAPLGALIGAALGWPRVFELLAGLSLLLIIANRRIWPTDTATAMMGAGAPLPPAGAALALRLLPTVVWATGLYGMYIYLGAWLSRLGFSTEAIAQVIACYGIGAIVGTLGGGRVADRVGARAATSASLIGLFAAFMLLPLTLRSGLLLGLGLGAASAVAQVFFPAQQAGLVSDFPARRATVLAWNNSSLFLGIALGSLVGGQTIAHGSWETSLLICATIALVGWLINRRVTRRLALG
ncbi:MAG TPA: MFS transporter [Stellaceae bacterium]|jgi:predicted MFS family arabinose efflux permease|nr:MFS transporter [Stellaceae bacterium]